MSKFLNQFKSTESWVFDLDNTLYCASTNIFGQIDVRMKSFISELLDIEPDKAHKIQKKYFHDYGTTLRGLMDRHNVNPKSFLDHVHDINIQDLKPNLKLEKSLHKIPGRKIIFTNADVNHAERVMKRLGIIDHFEAVFDIVACNYIPKPEPQAYLDLISHFDLDPKKTVFFEDMARNLKPASDLGMTTVWVQTDTILKNHNSKESYINYVTSDLTSLLFDIASLY